MGNVRLLHLILFPIVIVASYACTSGPWPHATVQTQGLGEGQIAEYFKQSLICCSPGVNNTVLEKVKKLLAESSKNLSLRESAESIGMKCVAPPDTTCGYTGEYRTRSDSPNAGRWYVVDILILLPNYEELSSLVVNVHQRVTE